jgi:cell division protein FtsB
MCVIRLRLVIEGKRFLERYGVATKGKIILSVGMLIFLGFLFVVGLGDRGAADLYQLKLQRDRLRQANAELQKRNEAQYRTIERLKHDAEFVESIARRELGMIAKDEVVILKKKK